MEEDLGFVRTRLRQMIDPWFETHGGTVRGRELALPPVDLEDRGTTFDVRFDLPGIPKDRVSVKVLGQRIEVKAELAAESTASKKSYVLHERAHRGYERVVELPQPVIGSEAQATFEAGVLTVSVPKTRQAAEHRIHIA